MIRTWLCHVNCWLRASTTSCSAATLLQDELMAAGKRKDLPQKGTNVWAPAAREDAMAYGPDWRTLVLQDRSWDPTNMKLFPRTVEILRDELQVPSSEVFFARQAPKTGIKPHTDNTNFILTAHLGLAVPEGECWMQVGNERKEWRNGKMLIFDTSFVHSTGNEADVDRTVLLIRFWHPEVTTVERRALEFIFAAIENPALIETPSAERQMLEEFKRSLVAEKPAAQGMSRQARRKAERDAKKKSK